MSDPHTPSLTDQAGHWAVTGIFVIMTLGVLTIAQGLIIPLISGFMIALILSPVRRALSSIGIPSGAAAFILMGGLILFLAGFIYIVGGTLYERIMEAPEAMDAIEKRIGMLFGQVQPVLEATQQIEDITTDENVEMIVVREPGFMADAASYVPRLAGQAVIAFTLAFFLIASGDLFYEKLVQVMPTLKDKKRALAIAQKIESQLSAYLFTITLINIALGVCVATAMWALGMPSPVLFGVAAFLLNYVPYLGAITGIIGTFLIALVTFDAPLAAIIPALAYAALTSTEGQFVTPYLVGRRLQMNAVVVFISFAVWAWLWSYMGMLLSTPMLLTLKVVSDQVPGLNGFGHFLAGRGDLSRRDGRLIRYIFKEADVTPDIHEDPTLPA